LRLVCREVEVAFEIAQNVLGGLVRRALVDFGDDATGREQLARGDLDVRRLTAGLADGRLVDEDLAVRLGHPFAGCARARRRGA